ncbi:MAG: exodeoxyribonuclease VII small subunit [Thermodesulfovibrionales bacterium]|nr:exodeoxyribonuclease VII small subunit [Thermodesulfovibrionales bacterium]
MQQDKITYSQALNELEQIVSSIESQEADIDDLANKVKRASELIIYCRNKLRGTEEDINKVLDESLVS